MKCIECKWYQDGICYNCDGYDKPLYGVGICEKSAKEETNCKAFEKMATAIPPALDGGLRLPKA